ncbi:unnamed protein product [Aphanomyces euteiches]
MDRPPTHLAIRPEGTAPPIIMWMQQSMEGGGHNQPPRYNNYGGGGFQGGQRGSNDEDWKSKLVSNGQWLGEKVMALATRSHNTIPDNQRAVNDGRANWMAEIRNNTGPSNNSHFSSGSGYNGGGYQNDFATERPGHYSDTAYRPSSYSDSAYKSQPTTSYKPSKSKSNNKKHKKKSKHDSTSDESEEESEESESSEESDPKPKKSTKVRTKAKVVKPEVIASDDSEEEAPVKSKKALKKGKKSKKELSESEDDASTESAPEDKKKTKAKSKKSNYTYSFDPKSIPVAPEETDKKGKKKATKKSDKAEKSSKPTNDAAVDLLGVKSLTISSAPVVQAPAPPLSTIDQLAGLSFDPMDSVQPQQSYQMHQNFHPQMQQPLQPAQREQHQASAAPTQQQGLPNGFDVPGSNLVDLRLSSEVAAAKAATPTDTRSLDQLKASTPQQPPQPSMPLPPMMPTPQMPMMMQPQMHMMPNPQMMMMQQQQQQLMLGQFAMQQPQVVVPHGISAPYAGYPTPQQRQQMMMQSQAAPGFM